MVIVPQTICLETLANLCVKSASVMTKYMESGVNFYVQKGYRLGLMVLINQPVIVFKAC